MNKHLSQDNQQFKRVYNMEIQENLLKYIDFPFSFSAITLIFFPSFEDIILENFLSIAFIAGLLASSLEIIDPFKRIISNNLKNQIYHDFDYHKKHEKGENDKKESWDIGFAINDAFENKQILKKFNKITAMFYLVILLFISPIKLTNIFHQFNIPYHNIFSFLPYILIPLVLKYTFYEYKELPKKLLITCFYLIGISRNAIGYYHEIENSLQNDDWPRAWYYLHRDYNENKLEIDPEVMLQNILDGLSKTRMGKLASIFRIKMKP